MNGQTENLVEHEIQTPENSLVSLASKAEIDQQITTEEKSLWGDDKAHRAHSRQRLDAYRRGLQVLATR